MFCFFLIPSFSFGVVGLKDSTQTNFFFFPLSYLDNLGASKSKPDSHCDPQEHGLQETSRNRTPADFSAVKPPFVPQTPLYRAAAFNERILSPVSETGRHRIFLCSYNLNNLFCSGSRSAGLHRKSTRHFFLMSV